MQSSHFMADVQQFELFQFYGCSLLIVAWPRRAITKSLAICSNRWIHLEVPLPTQVLCFIASSWWSTQMIGLFTRCELVTMLSRQVTGLLLQNCWSALKWHLRRILCQFWETTIFWLVLFYFLACEWNSELVNNQAHCGTVYRPFSSSNIQGSKCTLWCHLWPSRTAMSEQNWKALDWFVDIRLQISHLTWKATQLACSWTQKRLLQVKLFDCWFSCMF